MLYSILTPAYNRAHTLLSVYASLKNQTLRDFEWVIVDDGSTDHTFELIQQWQQEAPFAIRYFKQRNQGRHVATNVAIEAAKGTFSVLLDSDEYLKPDGLERLLYHWESIPESQRQTFIGVTALMEYDSGKLMGQKFPQDVFDSDTTEIGYILRFDGERKGLIRTDILKKHLYPVFHGEKYMSDSFIWHQIARHYKTRFVNDVVCMAEYLPDGITQNVVSILLKSPKSTSLYYQELLDDPHSFSLKVRAGLYAYFVRYSLHAGYSWKYILSEMKNPIYATIGALAGSLFFFRDARKLTAIKKALTPASEVSVFKTVHQ